MHWTFLLVIEHPQTACHSSCEHLVRCAVWSSGTGLLGHKRVIIECRTHVVDMHEEVELRLKECNWGFPDMWVLDFCFIIIVIIYCRVLLLRDSLTYASNTLVYDCDCKSLHTALQHCCRAYKHIKLPREKHPQHLGEVKCSRGEVKHSIVLCCCNSRSQISSESSEPHSFKINEKDQVWKISAGKHLGFE